MISVKVPNPDKTASKSTRVNGLADYITAPENTQSIEKCIASGAENFLTRTHEGQKAEMVALAQEAVRSKDPIEHFILSWKENEKPTPEQAKEAVEIFVKQCGLTGHQYIWGLHDDTQNMHVHIAINRIHPVTYKAIEINKGFDREAQQQAVALIEHKQGWSREEHARYNVVDGKPVLSQAGQLAKERGKTPVSKRESDMELRTGEKSAKRHTIEEAAPIIANAKSWKELHAGLAAIGMEYRRDGSGAKVFVGEVGIKASDVDRKASFGTLQKRLGIFQPAQEIKHNDYHHHTPQPYSVTHGPQAGNSMRSLSECRLAFGDETGRIKTHRAGVLQIDARANRQRVDGVRRDSGRSAGRSEPLTNNQPGWTEYNAVRKAEQAAREQRNVDLKIRQDAERKALSARQQAHRTEAFGGSWKGNGDLLNQMRSVIAAQQAVEKLNLREQHKAERKALQQRQTPSYEQWLRQHGAEDLAEKWRYKDHPDRQPCLIIGKNLQPIEHRDIRDYEFRIIGREVEYQLRGGGGPAFVDRGKTIAVLESKSPAAVLAAMQLGAQKFGGKITVTGNDEYKQLCVQLAIKNGIQIANPELQQIITAEKQRIEQQRNAERQAAEKCRITAQMVKEPEAMPNRTPQPEPIAPPAPPQLSLAERWNAKPSREMVGPVVAVEGRMVIQAAGQGRHVIHELTPDSPIPPVSDEVRTIKNGVLKQTPREFAQELVRQAQQREAEKEADKIIAGREVSPKDRAELVEIIRKDQAKDRQLQQEISRQISKDQGLGR